MVAIVAKLIFFIEILSFRGLDRGSVFGRQCNVGPQDLNIVTGISLVGLDAPTTA
jgi:hypothetical protein